MKGRDVTARAGVCNRLAPIGSRQRNVQKQLSDIVESEKDLTGASIHVISPRIHLDWGATAGVTERSGDTPITIHHPLRVASVTKSFVAAAVLRLHEQERIDLTADMRRYLPKKYIAILEAGGYSLGRITLRQLLSHTTGFPDFFYTEAFAALQPDLLSGRYKHLFTLEEQLRMAMTAKPAGVPGERYFYSDTNYILLGAILEEVTQSNMGVATRELVGYDRLGLKSTWWETLEPPPIDARPLLHQYLGEHDSYNNTPPFDLYGGGGMVSTPQDIARFFYHLFHGRVFEKQSTLKLMLDKLETGYPDIEKPDARTTPGIYGLGIMRKDICGYATYGHSGWWGINACYVPELNVAIGVAVTQQNLSKLIWALSEIIIKEVAV